MAHRPDLCVLRPENFQTDAWGYRNSPQVFERHNDILVFGDSFAFGQGMLQEDGPSEQISRLLGENAYDGAGKIELNYLFWLLGQHKNQPPKRVIYFHLERHHLSLKNLVELESRLSNNRSEAVKVDWETITHYNPLKIMAGKIERRWFVPWIFPNRFDEPVYKLRNGREFLFLPSSIEQYGEPRTGDAKEEADFFVALGSILKRRGIELVVLLIPEKYTVYAELLENPPKIVSNSLLYLNLLETNLKFRSETLTIPLTIVNLLPPFKMAAKSALANNEYIYWPDDSHWNPRGVKILVDELGRQLKKTSQK